MKRTFLDEVRHVWEVGPIRQPLTSSYNLELTFVPELPEEDSRVARNSRVAAIVPLYRGRRIQFHLAATAYRIASAPPV